MQGLACLKQYVNTSKYWMDNWGLPLIQEYLNKNNPKIQLIIIYTMNPLKTNQPYCIADVKVIPPVKYNNYVLIWWNINHFELIVYDKIQTYFTYKTLPESVKQLIRDRNKNAETCMQDGNYPIF